MFTNHALTLWGKGRLLLSMGTFVVSCTETDEPIDLPFGRRKYKLHRIRQAAPMCPREKAHWRHWRIRLNHPSAPAMRSYVKVKLL